MIARALLVIAFLVLVEAALGQPPQPPCSTPPAGKGQAIKPYSGPEGELTDVQRKLLDAAAGHFMEQEWDKAAKAYQQITKEHPSIGIAWFRLGYALHIQDKLEDAIKAHEKAAEFSRYACTANYNLGCAYSRLGKKDKALTYLEKATKLGFTRIDFFENDPDLVNVRTEPHFQALLASLRSAVNPEFYHQLDFWIGEWQVTDTAGRKVGTSIVKKVENDFLITERWTSSGGYTASSFFYFDSSDRKWHLTWVHGNGEIIRATGTVKKAVLDFEGDHINPSDGKVSNLRGKLALQGDGRIKQTLELAKDGKNWHAYFEGTFAPMTAKAR